MSTVAEIRKAIEELSLEERVELFASFTRFEDDAWDRQMKADAEAGKFDEMHRQAIEDLRAGRCVPLEEGL
ncbi:MAG: hypothetical protein ABMA13_19945 [Chthoniobacteraceae bacterium]